MLLWAFAAFFAGCVSCAAAGRAKVRIFHKKKSPTERPGVL
jgi:hypothetical protein